MVPHSSFTDHSHWSQDTCPSITTLLFWITYHTLSSVQLLNRVQLFVILWTGARQASLPITNSRSLLKLTSIESVMPSNHLILCRPLLLLPSIFPSIRIFSSESVLRIKWPKYWSQFLASSGQSIGASVSASVLPITHSIVW